MASERRDILSELAEARNRAEREIRKAEIERDRRAEDGERMTVEWLQGFIDRSRTFMHRLDEIIFKRPEDE